MLILQIRQMRIRKERSYKNRHLLHIQKFLSSKAHCLGVHSSPVVVDHIHCTDALAAAGTFITVRTNFKTLLGTFLLRPMLSGQKKTSMSKGERKFHMHNCKAHVTTIFSIELVQPTPVQCTSSWQEVLETMRLYQSLIQFKLQINASYGNSIQTKFMKWQNSKGASPHAADKAYL